MKSDFLQFSKKIRMVICKGIDRQPLHSATYAIITMEAEAAMALPNDLLADVLGRLPARSLAASRRVCKAWRDLVDERRLLLRLRRLLPHSLRGLFINYQHCDRPHFFARPAPAAGGPRIDGEFGFIAREGPYRPTAGTRSWTTATASSSTGAATSRCCTCATPRRDGGLACRRRAPATLTAAAARSSCLTPPHRRRTKGAAGARARRAERG